MALLFAFGHWGRRWTP